MASTFLPLKEQTEVAQSLGAQPVSRSAWKAPESADPAEWKEEFKNALKAKEKQIGWWLQSPEHRADMQFYLDYEHAQDSAWDELGGKGAFELCLER